MIDDDKTGELDRILATEAITPIYQPLVELPSGRVVGYEALARGPAGSPLESPNELFTTARAAGKLRQLDWICRTAAVRGALGGRLRPPLTLFLNSEPDTIGSRVSIDFAESWARARLASLSLVFEVTERGVLDRPAQLLKAVDQIRHFGWGVALDDVGTNPASLALLPFVKPDVIKLDMSLVHLTAVDIGEVILAVNAEAERSGATILAEGIENREHLELALTFGASLGQGWLFGRPEPLPDPLPSAGSPIVVSTKHRSREPQATPYPIVTRKRIARRATQEQLVQASRLIERRALQLPHPPLLIAAFQHARHFTAETRGVYERMARRLPFVAGLAEGWTDPSPEGVRFVSLQPDDPLTSEWAVGILTPFSAMLLSARERDNGSPDERIFDAAMTFDRDLAIEAAESLLQRLEVADEAGDVADEEVEFADAVTRILATAEREQDLARPLLKMMSELTGLESTFLSRVSDEHRYDVVVSYNNGSLSVDEGYSMPWTETICHDALALGRQAFDDVQGELDDNRVGSEFGFRTYVTCPVIGDDGELAGTLCGASERVSPLTDAQIEMVRRFARLIAGRIDR